MWLGWGSLRVHVAVVLGLSAPPAFTVHQAAGDGSFGDLLIFDENDALHADRVAAPSFDVNFDSQLLSRNHRPAKASFFNPGETHELVLAVGNFGEQQRTARLSN